jgi:hypothetical protein
VHGRPNSALCVVSCSHLPDGSASGACTEPARLALSTKHLTELSRAQGPRLHFVLFACELSQTSLLSGPTSEALLGQRFLLTTLLPTVRNNGAVPSCL